MAKRLIGIDFGTSSTFMKVKRYKNDGSPAGGRLDFKPVIFDSGSGSAALPTIIQKAGAGAQEHSWYGVEAEALRPGGVMHRNFKVELESYDPQRRANARALTKQMFSFLFRKYQEQRQFLGEADDTEETIVSYPAKWSEETQRFMTETAKQAGFPNVRGTDEATASINAVLVQKQEEMRQIGILNGNQPFLFLVVDMGAGTTDLAVCQYTPGIKSRNKVIATWPGEENPILFGGREIDSRLGGYFEQLLKRDGISEQIAESIPAQQGEKVKEWKERTLSDALNRGEAITYCSFLVPFYNMLGISPSAFTFDRTEFERLLSSYLRQFPELIWGCLSDTAKKLPGFSPTDIDMVILTGGHSQWYFVREMLSGIMTKYGDIRLPKITGDKKRLFIMPRPQEIVSLGLVYQPLMNGADSHQRQNLGSGQQRTVDEQPHYSKQSAQDPDPKDADSLFALGTSYYSKGTEPDYRMAAQYFLKAANRGHVLAQCNLGAMYAEGQGVARDYGQAFAWFKRAAGQNLPAAQYNLGRMYYNGKGVGQNYEAAAAWFKKAAGQGDSDARYMIGIMYYNGMGVARDTSLGKRWLRQAAAQGDDNARKALEEITSAPEEFEVRDNKYVSDAEKVRLLARLPAEQASELLLKCGGDVNCALRASYGEMVNESSAAFLQRISAKGRENRTIFTAVRDSLWDVPMHTPKAINPQIDTIFHSAAKLQSDEKLLFYSDYGSSGKYKKVFIFTDQRIVGVKKQATANRYSVDEEMKFQDVRAFLQVLDKKNGELNRIAFVGASYNILMSLAGGLERWPDNDIRMIYATYFRYRKEHGYEPYSTSLMTQEI